MFESCGTNLATIVHMFESCHKIWCTGDAEIPICSGNSLTVQCLSSATHCWHTATNMSLWMDTEFSTAVCVGSWLSSAQMPILPCSCSVWLGTIIQFRHLCTTSQFISAVKNFCFHVRKLSHFTSGSPTLMTFALADACVLLWIYPLPLTSCTGTTARHEIWLLLLLPSVGPDPAIFISSF